MAELVLLTLLACTSTKDSTLAAADADGDGVASPSDCDDGDARTHPGAQELGDGVDRDCDGAAPPPAGTVAGVVRDGGAGSAVLQADGVSWVGAPWGAPGSDAERWPAGGFVREDARGEATNLEGRAGEALGAAFARLDDGTVLVGAPGVGEVRTATGEVRAREDGLGGRLASRGQVWVARTRTGVVRVTAEGIATSMDTATRPDSLAVLATGEVVAGMATGPIALQAFSTDGARIDVLRSETPAGQHPDEAGWALAACDIDADGREEVLVGAPGAGRVFVLASLATAWSAAASFGTGEGRFGASIACGDAGVVYVGAPMEGADVVGAVYAYRGGVLTPLRSGTTRDAQLGFALSYGDDSLLVGAPGASGEPGSAVRIVP